MTTVSLAQYVARGAAPPMRECLAALAAGRLWEVDTRSAGHHYVTISDDAEDAVHEVAGHVGAHDHVMAGWSSQAITALRGTLCDGVAAVLVTQGAESSVHVVVRWPGGHHAARQSLHDELTQMLDGVEAYSLGAEGEGEGEAWTFAVWPDGVALE